MMESMAESPADRQILLIYPDAVGPRMGGVGIRATELAKVLRSYGEVTLAVAQGEGDWDFPLAVFNPHDPRALAPHIERADVVVSRPLWPLAMQMLRRSGARLIFDLYDPETIPTIEHYAGRSQLRRKLMAAFATDRLSESIRIGHHFACIDDSQRDFLLGVMLAEGAISPALYDRDRTLRSVIDVVPFGVDPEPPRRSDHPGIRAAFPEIGPDDEIVLWNGGIWDWFDAPTAIRGVIVLAERRPSVKLVFMVSFGPEHRAAHEARTLAEQLRAMGKSVFFSDSWVPYQRRGDWLLDADCAVSTHIEQADFRAFRGRLLDCFWAGLPIVCTEGGDLGRRIEQEGLGIAVPEGDVEAVAAGLEQVLDGGKGAYAEGLRRAAAEFAWTTVSRPLVRFVTSEPDAPRLSRDRIHGRIPSALRSAGYRGVRRCLNLIGLSNWPKA